MTSFFAWTRLISHRIIDDGCSFKGRPAGLCGVHGLAATCAELKILQIDKIYLERGFDPFFLQTQKKLGRFFICWSKTCAKKKKILSSSLLERLDFCSLLYLKNVSDLFHKLILWRKKVLFPHKKQKKTRLKLSLHNYNPRYIPPFFCIYEKNIYLDLVWSVEY